MAAKVCGPTGAAALVLCPNDLPLALCPNDLPLALCPNDLPLAFSSASRRKGVALLLAVLPKFDLSLVLLPNGRPVSLL